MTPYLVTGPTQAPVTLSEMLVQLRIEADAPTETALEVSEMIGEAVAHLDGYGGALGRCIMPQSWAVDVVGPGPHLLPFPDASNVAAASGVDSLEVTTEICPQGIYATVSDAVADQEVTITATYALPAQRLPAVKRLIKLIVTTWYDNRASVIVGKSVSTLPMAADALVSALRWRQI